MIQTNTKLCILYIGRIDGCQDFEQQTKKSEKFSAFTDPAEIKSTSTNRQEVP